MSPLPVSQSTVEAILVPTFKSRWGWLPCCYNTYVMLKRLHRIGFHALRQFHALKRWQRKLPRNRVIRMYRYNHKGQKIAATIVGSQPEPLVHPVFATRVELPLGAHRVDFHHELWQRVVTSYRLARRPKENSQDVEAMPMSLHEISDLLDLYNITP